MNDGLKQRLAGLYPEGKFVPSVWWGRGLVALAWLRRKPVVRRSVPPVTGRWQPPTELRPTERRQSDVRRMEKPGRQARRTGSR
jgi:hypothetical protein